MGEGFFLGFPGYKDQSALSFLKGRSSRFFHFFAVCSTMSRQEIFLVVVFVLYYNGVYSSVLVIREPWIS